MAGSGSMHLALPCLARIIRVTRSDRSSLLMIQQVTASTRTVRKTTAARAGMPSRTKRAAGSIPATPRPACFRAFFKALRSCGAEIAAQNPSEAR